MPRDNLVVGLDIGTTKVVAVIGEVSGPGSIDIIGVGAADSRGIRQGVVINIEATLRSVREAVEAAELMSGREVGSLVTGIAGAHIEGINSRGVVAVTARGREIDKDDLARVIEAAKAVVIPMDREVLHVIPQEFIVDDQGGIKDPLDMIGVRLEAEVHIITGSVTSAQNLLKCVNRAGFRVEKMVLGSLACAETILTSDEKDMGVLMIDLGGGTTDILVYLEGAPYYTDVVPIGGSQVTSDLSIMLKTPMEGAERIKKESGCCYVDLVEDGEEVLIPSVAGWPAASIPRKEIARIIQPRMEEIFDMVKERLEGRDYLRLLGGGVVLTGGGALLPGTAELARDHFGLPARVGAPGSFGGLVSEYRNPSYSVAVGLLKYAAERVIADDGEVDVEPRRGDGMMKRFTDWIREFF